jgi:hypothetical protein
MKWMFAVAAAAALTALGAAPKPLPGQAGNDDIDLTASVLVDRSEIEQAVGVDLGAGYLAVRMKATPKTDKPLRIGPDDFTMVSRKDGQRSQALTPNEIAGHGGTLIVKTGDQRGGGGSTRRTLGIGGFGGGSVGNSTNNNTNVDAHVEQGTEKSDGKDSPLMAALKEKGLPDQETKEPLEGLLYFPIEGKIKPKDVAVIYKGPAGKLIIEFQNPKGGR